MRLIAVSLLLCCAACFTADLAGHACPCLAGYLCVNEVCVTREQARGMCPERFVATDKCGDAPPASATLVAVCDDGESFPSELVSETGGGAGFCTGPPAVATLSDDALTGGFTASAGGNGDGTLNLTLSGTTSWSLDVPESCQVSPGLCLPSDGTGSCGADGDGCRCTGVELTHTSDELEVLGGDYYGSGTAYFGCNLGATFALREDDGIGLGPILLFAPE